MAALSEPAGYFDTDNLISNQRSTCRFCPRSSVRLRAAASTSASAPIRTSGTPPSSGRRWRSSSTSAVTTCCFTFSSRRCSPKRGRASSTSHCCSAVLYHPTSTVARANLDRCCRRSTPRPIEEGSTRFARESTDASPARCSALARRSRHHRSVPSTIHRGRSGAAIRKYGRPPQSGYPTYRDL